jgi:hypothetical protein
MHNNTIKMKSKSAISFKELQHMANEVVDFGNDWGFYVDIETNNKLIEFTYFKKEKFNKKKIIYETIKEYENIEEKRFFNNNENNENKKNKKAENSEKIIINRNYNYFCNFMKIYLIKYSFPIITTFLVSYYIFRN